MNEERPSASADSAQLTAHSPRSPLTARCLRCGFSVEPAPAGCKHPCPNCGFIYPLGDCSD